jgi:long-subunit fatty acid transport protein
VDPGDSINIALGMGLSLNEQFSMSLGFKYDYVFPTQEEAFTQDNNTGISSNTDLETDKLQVASFLVGWSYQVNEMVGVNLNFEVGATDDANDFSVRLGVPIRFNNLFGRGVEE